MKRAILSIASLCLLLAPLSALAAVHISEIAWMGTKESANNEWIELWNDSNVTVPLTGWKLSWGSGTPKVVSLAGNIAPGDYYLLERTDDATVPGVVADLVYVGALGNSGETMTLKDGAGSVIDSLAFSGGWPAGDNTTKDTMQLVAGGWVTGPGTPKAAPVVSGTSDRTATTTGETATTTTDATLEQTTKTSANQTLSAHAASEPLSSDEPNPIFTISVGRDRLAVVDEPVRFAARAWLGRAELPATVNYVWSFGDGESGVGAVTEHSYRFPGRYVVVLNADQGKTHAVDRTTIDVGKATLVLRDDVGGEGTHVALENTGGQEINVGGFVVQTPKKSFTFPDDTLLLPKQVIHVDAEKLAFSCAEASTTITLLSPRGRVVGALVRTPKGKEPSALATSTTTALYVSMRAQLALLREQLARLLGATQSTTTPRFTSATLSAIVGGPKK